MFLHLATSTWTELLNVPAAFKREITGHKTLLALERWRDLVRSQGRNESRLKRIASHRRCARRPQKVVGCEKLQYPFDILTMKSSAPSLVKLIDFRIRFAGNTHDRGNDERVLLTNYGGGGGVG